MIYVSLPDRNVRPLPFYLAMEEYIASMTPESTFFMWQVRPTVIFGRNQLISKEVDIDYCRDNGIEFYRRKSGGGCVYADMDNIMLSHTESTNRSISTTFTAYTDAVAKMLRALGLDASASGRNDVTVDGMKISGNAFYNCAGRAIVHGTMLFDTNLEHMARAIHPSTEKLKAKGVASVSSRITTLRRHLDISIDDFKAHMRSFLGADGEIRLTDSDVAEIERIAEPYFTRQWIYGRNPESVRSHTVRLEGVGEFTVSLAIDGDRISDINLSGDFFLLSDLDTSLLDHLRGCPYSPLAIGQVIDTLPDPATMIQGMTRDKLKSILIPETKQQ